MGFISGAVLAYAFLTIALGAYGYFDKGSMTSLIAGGVAGLLLLGSLALTKTHPRAGRIASAVIALLMLGQMGRKALEDKTWHTITLSVASVLIIAILVGGHLMATSKKKAGEPE